MKLARLLALVALLISVAVSVGPVLAQQPDATSGRNEVAEQEILDRLALVNPAAVSLFQAATQALDSGDYAPAKQGFEAVLDLAAEFPDAERRLSYVEVRLKNYPSAIAHAERALSADPSPFNHRALAEALLASGEARQARAAYDHARMAVKGLPNDAGTQQILLLAASNVHEKQVAREASARLLALAPTYAPSHYFAGLLAGMDGQWEKAEAELLEAQQLGMPAEQVQRVLDETGIHRQAQMRRIIRGGVWGLVGWLVTGALLFVVGLALSRATLAAVARYKTDSQATMGTAEARVRSVYRLVIALTSLYFYVSIPILILLVVAITLGLLFLLMTLEYIPVRLAFVIGIIGLVTLSALVKSVLFRLRDTVPGRPLTREEAPALWVLATNVAHRLGTRPIDAIYITPGTDMAVTERGGLLKKLRGDGQRCLILGLGVLPGMTQGQFEAILGHEYGHFNHRDTAGGDLALPVEIAIHRLAYGLARGGQATWYNPVWWFVKGFYLMFLRITLGASRLQEILADRYTVLTFGARNFIDGLLHIVRQELTFQWQVSREVAFAVAHHSRLTNLYQLPPPSDSAALDSIEKDYEAILSRPTSPYDSHPSVKERIELARQLQGDEGIGRPEPVWDLLPTAEALQAEMTASVQTRLEAHQPDEATG